ncbi:hypothetical protein T459_13192 [Capsicum annuum]|uniref:Cytochrome 82A3 n=1 Tax=Capsicum annuum TaxID=4072 RepID=A0A2G2ZRZ0_CAPAN|nr:hypothetical protein T459_13192 [Capsicum annuum]
MAFANRPKSIASEILGYNYAMFGLGPYGPYWREMRKIVTIEFLSARRIDMFSHVQEFEVKSAVKKTYEYCFKNKSSNLNDVVKMEMKEWFGNLIMNTMVKILFGVQYKDNEDRSKAHKAIRRFVELFGVFIVADFLPYLRWLDIGGHEKAMKETAKEIDIILEDWLAEHKRKRKLKGNKSGDEDFMDVMLSICEDKDLYGFDADAVIKATCYAIGSHTTHATPESIEDCVVGGYDIPKGTRLLLNIWKIHYDPDIWPNPQEFKPDRFLTTHKDVNVRGNHFELMLFGSGRRMCPGVSLGLQVMQYVMAVLLQGFKITSPSDEPIDMSENFGLTILKASPLEVHLAPRLYSNLYELNNDLF